MEKFDRPVNMPIHAFDNFIGGEDPAHASRLARNTAQALLHRVREADDPDVIERTVGYARHNGLADLAELWSNANPHSLAGSLWRLYLVHEAIAQDPESSSYIYRRGVSVDTSIHHIVAGAVEPTGPLEIRSLTETIFRGAFSGDFEDALDRAAAFCSVMSLGCASIAADHEHSEPERASRATKRSARYLGFAKDLAASARLWRKGLLD
ncbi:DNA-directed RNA polymerase subunit beta [Gulosibacter chungangensis]|uniref:DNA-directed RNA polymerase subunit beta n=1 Tax=Gulosibacter chungangensis TaxID=979746 RepID=A0A7J5BCZ3_9MICO|nr:DNA-directed RNA polymerase subunit beta [Gulosibacter chungangensis]KAB1643077.1 DNA-directed RNA polymerase subunit beta [Gulosibacter chungangensis]